MEFVVAFVYVLSAAVLAFGTLTRVGRKHRGFWVLLFVVLLALATALRTATGG